MNRNLEEDVRRVAERASQWLEVLEDEPGEEKRAAFAAWIAESPLHVREFLNIAAVDRMLENLDPHKRLAIETGGQGTGPDVLPLQSQIPISQARPKRAAARWTMAAGIAVVITGALLGWQHEREWHEYVTAVGEQSNIELADKTAVSLNTGTRLAVRFTTKAREIRLIEGEALFTVHQDAMRPFRVHSGASVIQAIGTAFDVHRQPSGETTVSVIEGRIQVSANAAFSGSSPPRLGAGEQIHISAKGRLDPPHEVDAAAVTAWRERRLVFHRATLEDIATEFNRYNESPHIKVEDSALRERRYTVVLPADDPESLIDYLRQSPDVAFSHQGNEVQIRGR